MFSPFPIAWGLVMNASEEFELLQGHLFSLDSQLVVQLPLGSALHTQNGRVEFGTSFARDTQGVRAASVGPHVGESDLFRGALLEQEAVFGVEQEDGECAVQKTLINVAHQVACRNHPWISNCS